MSRPPWEELERPGADTVIVAGVAVRRGSRVRLRPRPGGDVFDIALSGRTALVAQIEQDVDGTVQVAVTVDDDPGRDLGAANQPGHRFFFAPEEVEPIAARRVLVAGIGNVFLGDDGFGVAVAQRLAGRELPAGVEARDFGIRGMDLAYALDDYDAAVLVDAVARGGEPGTLYVIEPDLDVSTGQFQAHGMDPVSVLALARELGATPGRVLVVGCEPLRVVAEDEEDLVVELSEPVRAAVDGAVSLVVDLLAELESNEGSE